MPYNSVFSFILQFMSILLGTRLGLVYQVVSQLYKLIHWIKYILDLLCTLYS